MEEGQEAVRRGAVMVTHMFNAMEAFHHRWRSHSVETTPPRAPGLLGLLMREEKLWFGLIVDGEHVCPEAVRLVQRLHPGGLVLVTGGGGQVLAPWLPQMPSPGWARRNRHAKWNDCVSFNAEG